MRKLGPREIMKAGMLPKQTVVRMVALLLLLFAAVDLFAIDLFAPSMCAPTTTSDGSGNPGADEDDCFCCCGHIVVRAPLHIVPVAAFSSDEPVVVVSPASVDRPSIYRPPRA